MSFSPGMGNARAVPRCFSWLAFAALGAYTAFIAMQTAVVAGGSDSSGYLNAARLFASGRLQTEVRLPPEFAGLPDLDRRQFVPQGFDLFPGETLVSPTYPPGLPLHFAAASRLLGWRAGPLLVQVLASAGAVWLCYASARQVQLHPHLAATAAALLAVLPVFLFTSLQTLSDTLATTWALAALYGGLRGRTSLAWSTACGAALAMAVLVRPTNLLLAPGLFVLVGTSLRGAAAFVLGGLPGAAWLAFYNHRLFGGTLASGYGAIFDTFGFEYVAPTALHFARWLALFLPPVVLALPLAVLVQRDTRRRETVAFALMAAGVMGVYLFYSVSHEVWWCLRFILPGIAPLTLLAMLGVEALVRHAAPRGHAVARSGAALLLAGWAVANSWYWTRRLDVLSVPRFEQTYARASQLARSRLPPGALVLCSHFSGSIYFYTTLPILGFEAPSRTQIDHYLAAAREAGRPVYAMIFDAERERLMTECCPGNWERVDGIDNVGLWHLQ